MSSMVVGVYEYVRFRFLSIGYKKRIAIQIGISFVLAFFCLLMSPFFTVNFDKIEGQASVDSSGNRLWESWIKSKLKKRPFRPIGDIYDNCQGKLSLARW